MTPETLFSTAIGSGGLVAAWVAWRADRVKGKRDELDLAALMRKFAAEEVAGAYEEIKALKAKVASLSRESSAAQQYIATLLAWWRIHLPGVEPPQPPPGYPDRPTP